MSRHDERDEFICFPSAWMMRSVRFDAGRFDDFAPLSRVGLHDRAEAFGRAGRDIRAEAGKTLFDVGQGEHAREIGIHAVSIKGRGNFNGARKPYQLLNS